MVSGGFQTVDARNGSFKEVTDETPGTGQRKFARRWYRGAQRNFPPPSSASGTVDLDGRFQRRRELCFLATRAGAEK